MYKMLAKTLHFLNQRVIFVYSKPAYNLPCFV